MSTTIEWASAQQPAELIDGNDEAADGNTPNNHPDDGRIAITIESCAVYGTPGELLEWLAGAVALVSEHLAGTR